KIAKRTIVGEDRHHRLLVMVTEGAYSLSDIAWVLQHSRLQLRQAMSMDGGRESEMVIVRGAFRYASSGAWTGEEEHPTTPESRAPLPCVTRAWSGAPPPRSRRRTTRNGTRRARSPSRTRARRPCSSPAGAGAASAGAPRRCPRASRRLP